MEEGDGFKGLAYYLSEEFYKDPPRAENMIRGARRTDEFAYEVDTLDGRDFEIRNRPLIEGGFVRTYTDITERKRAELEISNLYSIIRESVDYASNIQLATLPSSELLSLAFSDHFIIWEPRDVVGGDIYWCLPVKDGYVLAVADLLHVA